MPTGNVPAITAAGSISLKNLSSPSSRQAHLRQDRKTLQDLPLCLLRRLSGSPQFWILLAEALFKANQLNAYNLFGFGVNVNVEPFGQRHSDRFVRRAQGEIHDAFGGVVIKGDFPELYLLRKLG
jgi:hypothetical protein